MVKSIDERQTFSTVWQQVDRNRVNSKEILTPDPLEYLRAFDQNSSVEPYRAALFEALGAEVGDRVLDVGCGLGKQTSELCGVVGVNGRACGIDISSDIIRAASDNQERSSRCEFQVADVYELPFAEHEFDCVVEDRVLQHLSQPFDAAKEMLRVIRPGGRVVCADPDWRSFQIDVTGAGASTGEEGSRWGESRRPEEQLNFDLGALTVKLLNGVIPKLCAHSYIGLALPRLMRALGLVDIKLRCVPIVLNGWKDLECVVPITYLTKLSVNNGGVTDTEAKMWLDRLRWEGPRHLIGTLCMYIATGSKPGIPPSVKVKDSGLGGIRTTMRLRLATSVDLKTVDMLTQLINDVYMKSDTGITLSTSRVNADAVAGMVLRRELLLVEQRADDLVLGCIQAEVKEPWAKSGLPGGSARSGELSCLAVRAHVQGQRGQGTGSLLVRGAENMCRKLGCKQVQLGVLVPVEGENHYKRWLQEWYMRRGYDHRETLRLSYKPDELTKRYGYLSQIAPCKYEVYAKSP